MEETNRQDFKPKRKLRYGYIVLFIMLFLSLTVGCVYLFFQKPVGAGPDIPAPMTADHENIRMGAMFDPNREVRGLWIPTVMNLTFPSEAGLSADAMRAELDAIIRNVREANLNTVCFQVRPCADALYDSELFPTSKYLSGEQGKEADASFDPLAYLCEIARGTDGAEPIAVYAWVNPLRVTTAGQNVSDLSETNPAVLHPEWTHTYQKAVYWDAGIPEVRTLIASGVREICENYPIAGIIFDDYFYPYPAYGDDQRLLPIDDADTYAAYGTEYETVEDFRRGSINQMVELCYQTVKSVSGYLQFGIAPFGIWQNDNGTNGGSDTGGLEAYHALYCDARAWMEGGYLDFIAPQIYWQFTTGVAPYDTLVRWWNAYCDAYGIPLWISHALYQYENWNNPGEMRNQVTFARAENSYRGSLFYGYSQLLENTLGVTDELREVFSEDILYYDQESVPKTEEDGKPVVTINVPQNNSRYDENGTYLLGQSDPAVPLFCDGLPVSRTKSGYFAIYKPLQNGENTFLFSNGMAEESLTVWKGQNPPIKHQNPEDVESDSGETTVPLPKTASLLAPRSLTAEFWENGVTVSVRADEKAQVQAVLGENTLLLLQKELYSDGSALFSAVMPLVKTTEGTYSDCGQLLITVTGEGYETPVILEGPQIYAMGAGAVISVRVTKDRTYLKTAPDSWYYDDYIPASVGMTVSAHTIRNGYAQISLAGETAYLDASGIAVVDSEKTGITQLGILDLQVTEAETVIRIPAEQCIPVHGTKTGSVFTFTLYRAEIDMMPDGLLPENPLFSAYTAECGGEEENAYVTYTFRLLERDRFYGFSVSYTGGCVVISFRNPQKLSADSEKPLLGKIIVLDAGHGGRDSGALTPGSHQSLNEKDCNLAIVLEAQKRLKEYGADVILLRDADIAVDIYQRMDVIDQLCPDLVLSIHQNSMPQNTDISHIRGVVGLYWTESGRSLADCVAQAISVSLGRKQRDTQSQRLAMLRNHRFPAALIEVGFVTNAEEFETLCTHGAGGTASGIEKAAQAICDGILAWYKTQN